MKRLLRIALAALVMLAPAQAVRAADKPLVIESGQVKQLPAATALQLQAATTANASLILPHGAAPTGGALVDGAVWTTTAGVYVQVNGTTVGPLATGSGSVTHTAGALTANRLVLGNGGADVTVLGSLGTTTTLLHGNASGAPSFSAVDLAADVSGTLGVANGGTGAATLTAHGVVLGNATASVNVTAAGTAGKPLVSGGGSTDPSYATLGVSGGGTNCSTASGTCLDNVTGFGSLGFLVRTGAGTYSFQSMTNGITLANLVQASSGSLLLGRGSSGAGNFQEIALGSGLSITGTTLSSSGVVSASGSGLVNVSPTTGAATISLSNIGSGDLVANATAGSAAPADTTLTALIDRAFGSTQGMLLYRGASAWTALSPGTVGQLLQSGGSGANPSWTSGALSAAPKITLIQLHASVTIANNTFNKQSWVASDVIADEVTAWSSSTPTRITVPSGYTRAELLGTATWGSNSVGVRWINIYKNGTFIRGALHTAANESRTPAESTLLLGLVAGDYFEIEYAQTSGGNLTLGGSATQNNDAAAFQVKWYP